MFGFPHRPNGHWMRHTASVPKGFLRYYVLKLLNEKPMYGSEIMEQIEKETGERWKPSPGSIYPLLAWLQDNGYIEEMLKQESGIKRYRLMEQGKAFLEEQTKLKEKLDKKMEFFVPPFFGGFWMGAHREAMFKLREPARRFFESLIGLTVAVEENPSEQTLKEVSQILNGIAEKIEETSRKIKEGKADV